MIDIFLPLGFLLGLFYIVHRLPATFPASSLPSHSLTKPRPARTQWVFQRSGTNLTFSTKSLNPLPHFLLIYKKAEARNTRILTSIYGVAVVLGISGMMGGVAGAGWATVQVWSTVWEDIKQHAGVDDSRGKPAVSLEEAIGRTKMGLSDSPHMMAGGGLQPLIPGITTPFSHLPTMVLALLLNQVVHELGHALAAALEDIPPSRFSFSFHILLPSASVAFPKTVDHLPPKARMRIATSGPFHNLIVYLLLLGLAASGLHRLFWSDRSNMGRVITYIHPRSPIHGHLHVGDIITHLDEIDLSGQEDQWLSYLSGNDVSDEGRGWCMDEKLFRAAPLQPCMPFSDKITFRPTLSLPAFETTKCLPTHPMLDQASVPCPCGNPDSICIRPSPDEKILRIRVRGEERVIAYSGPRQDVLLSVGVSGQGPRMLDGVTRWATMFLEYLSMMSLSLFIFNLLPLPHTDGSQLLQAILSRPTKLSANHRRATLTAPLSSLGRCDDKEDENGYDSPDEKSQTGAWKDEGYASEESWKRRLRKGVEMGLMGVCAMWGVGWLMLALLRSS